MLEIIEANKVSVDIDLADLQKEISLFVQEADVEVIDQESYDLAWDFLKKIKDLKKAVDDRFEPVLSKVLAVKKLAENSRKTIMSLIEETAKDLDAADKKLRKATKEYNDKIIMAAKRHVITECGEAPVVEQGVKPAGAMYREVWRYRASGEPLDEAYTMLDAYGFRVPDHRKIGDAAILLKAACVIRGVEVYSEQIPVVR